MEVESIKFKISQNPFRFQGFFRNSLCLKKLAIEDAKKNQLFLKCIILCHNGYIANIMDINSTFFLKC